jgi:protein TonB
MFADSLLDSQWDNRSHRGWTTLASFALQALAVAALLLLPLLYTQGLPQLQLMASLVAPTPPPAPPAPAQMRSSPEARSNLSANGEIIAPRSIPTSILPVDESVAPPPVDASGIGVRGGTGDSSARNAVLDSIGNGLNVLPPPPPAAIDRPLRLSHMMEGNLIERVQPEYPMLARQARIQGSVVLRAVISREGRIKDLKVVAGHPMLVQAAMEAVRQWRYRPYLLNNEPVEVETQVTVNFTLGGG